MPPAHARQDVVRRGDAHVGRDEDLLEAVERVGVDRLLAAIRRVGPPDDVVEAPDELLLGPPETVAEPAEKAHGEVQSAAWTGRAGRARRTSM